MTPSEYMQQAKRTEKYDLDKIHERLSSIASIRLLHASQGMQTESAEFTDSLKKFLFYGAPLDVTNMKEEIGDLLWYVSICADCLGISFEEIFDINIAKLKARYPEGFTEVKAMNRDLNKEREVLECKNA